MTRTEERLADALDAAARALREDTLRPLLVPERPRRGSALAAPLAAAAALLLVVGLGVAVAGHLPGSERQSGPANSQPPYYIEVGFNGAPVVRSTASGAVTAAVEVPHVRYAAGQQSLVAAAANGLFFTVVQLAASVRAYRFRLTTAGTVTGIAPLRGGVLASSRWDADAIAASPDGSRVAVSLTPSCNVSSSGCSASGSTPSGGSPQNDQIEVIDTATGATSRWAGGIRHGYTFSTISLSWTSNGNELAYYGQWCPQNANSTTAWCTSGTGTRGAKAQVWILNPASNGGALTSGHMLFSLSAKYPYVPQAMISADGSAITAVVPTGLPGRVPTQTSALTRVAVEQIPLDTRKQPSVLYSRPLSQSTYFSLGTDATGQDWTFSGACSDGLCTNGFNGWIDHGRLVPLQPMKALFWDEVW